MKMGRLKLETQMGKIPMRATPYVRFLPLGTGDPDVCGKIRKPSESFKVPNICTTSKTITSLTLRLCGYLMGSSWDLHPPIQIDSGLVWLMTPFRAVRLTTSFGKKHGQVAGAGEGFVVWAERAS